jgi:alkylation response protein AidB-like acyl-CoA dehydrogenase
MSMNLGFSESQELFRQEVRSWMDENCVRDPMPESLDDQVEFLRTWQRSLADAHFVGVHWPVEWGGRGLSLIDNYIVQEEMALANAPEILNRVGVNLVGPVLLQWGTPEQKEAYLARILTAEDHWCQLFSEPDAGSDLGSMRTKATKVEGGWRISGQKIWTSYGHYADYGVLLARTSEPNERRQIGYFLLDMRQEGVETRPLRQLTGSAEFCEVFFDDAFVRDDRVVGNPSEGWKVMRTTIGYERTSSPRQLINHSRLLEDLLRQARAEKVDEVTRQALAKAYCELGIYRIHLKAALDSIERTGEPGPTGSLIKLYWSELSQRMHDVSLRMLGLGGVTEESSRAHDYLYYRSCTIIAGTSEIQRNTIADQVLHLPPEPRVAQTSRT